MRSFVSNASRLSSRSLPSRCGARSMLPRNGINIFHVERIGISGIKQQQHLAKVKASDSPLQSMEDNSMSPLKIALDAAKEKLAAAITVRERLEAEAQEVASLAVEAVNAAKTASSDFPLDKASAEKKAAEAEERAAAAMKAAELAAKEEMQCAAVVKETLNAVEKALTAISGDSSLSPASDRGASTTSASSTSSASSIEESEAAPKTEWVKTASLIAGSAALFCFFSYTSAGQQALSSLGGAVDLVKEKLSHIHIHDAEKGLLEAIILLLTSIICVPLVISKVPGGNAVLGYLLGGALIGPYGMGIIQDVTSIKHLAEMGVVFLLFNIGLELSIDRLVSLAKYVFGMGTLQVVLTVMGVAAVAMSIAGLSGPSAIILGGALAMSSTAVGIQVLEERHEMGSRHGRAIFSVLLLQDLAVVVLLMLIPLLAPSPDGSSVGGAQIAKALGTAAIKAVVCIGVIFAGGRLLIKPLYKRMSAFNAEIFSSTTLVVVLGTSFLTSLAGLSLALGAFLAGLLISETEYALQVESDIAPYKGLLMGLFFMSVGMEISGQLFLAKWKEVIAGMVLLIGGKLAVMAAIGPMFGLSRLAALRAGLLIAPGGEFAFVAFGEAMSRGVLPIPVTNLLYLVVALSMAMIPYLATFGGKLGAMMEKGDTKALQPKEEETKELKDHVIICGFGRSGQLIAELLSENQIPFVAVDQNIECVSKGKAKDLPVYFGDAGSPAVLHLLGAERAACAIIALDSAGACYRSVYTMQKHYPGVKTFARASDVKHGLVLEKAGATAVVPETLEPSLQLCSSILLTAFDYAPDEARRVIDDFRRSHVEQLTELAKASGLSAGYGHGSH